jgi:hypothetical protein
MSKGTHSPYATKPWAPSHRIVFGTGVVLPSAACALVALHATHPAQVLEVLEVSAPFSIATVYGGFPSCILRDPTEPLIVWHPCTPLESNCGKHPPP